MKIYSNVYDVKTRCHVQKWLLPLFSFRLTSLWDSYIFGKRAYIAPLCGAHFEIFQKVIFCKMLESEEVIYKLLSWFNAKLFVVTTFFFVLFIGFWSKNFKLWYHAIVVPRADNSVKVWRNLPISNLKPDLHNIIAQTKFHANPSMFTQVIIRKRKRTDRRTEVRLTDGQTHGPPTWNYHVARYQNEYYYFS